MKLTLTNNRTDGTNGALGNRVDNSMKLHERRATGAWVPCKHNSEFKSAYVPASTPSRNGLRTTPPTDANRGTKPPATRRKLDKKDVAQGNDSRPTVSPLEECYDLIAAHHRLHGIGANLLTPAVKKATLAHWQSLMDDGKISWVKLMKYKLPAFFAVWFGNAPEPPPFSKPDSPHMLLSSRPLLREMRKIVRGQSDVDGNSSQHLDHNVSQKKRKKNYNNFYGFVVGVNYLKKGLPRPDQAMLDEGIKGTIDILFKREPPKIQADVAELEMRMNERLMEEAVDKSFPLQYPKYHFNGRVTRRDLERQIIRTTHELFKGQVFSVDDFGNTTVPSLRANYQTSIKELGTFGLFQTNPDLQNFPGIYVGSSMKRCFDESLGEFRDVECLGVVRSEAHETNESIISFQNALREDPLCDPVALAEPLKVRIITKEPPYLMHSLRSFQKWMWNSLSRWRIFELLKKPEVRPETLSFLGPCGPGEKMLSGDYSAATNELRSWATQAVISAFRQHVNLGERTNQFFALLRRSLIGHEFLETLVGADGNLLGDTLLKQKNGQMMGSVTSFPILCIVNAALCRMTLEFDKGRSTSHSSGDLSLAECRMLINGDDCVFSVSPIGYEYWRRVGRVVGLIPSVGKFYYCRYYLNINSTSFYYSPFEASVYRETESVCPTYEQVIVPWTQQKYVNWGLITGKKRSQESEEKNSKIQKKSDPVTEIIKAHNDNMSLSQISFKIVETSPDHLRRGALKQFIDRRIRPHFSEGTIPWFVPESFGGLGIYPYFGGLRDVEKQRCQYLQGCHDAHKKIMKVRNFALAPVWSVLSDKIKKLGEKLYSNVESISSSDGIYESMLSNYDDAKGQFIALSPYFINGTELSQDPKTFALRIRAMLSVNRKTWRDILRVKNLPRYQGFDPWKVSSLPSILALGSVGGKSLPSDELNTVLSDTSSNWKALRDIA